jgi:hypothetical protein
MASSPSNSVHSGFNVSRPGHPSPAHCLPTGMPNLEKLESVPEIQMPHMASLDPHFSGDHYYTSILFVGC